MSCVCRLASLQALDTALGSLRVALAHPGKVSCSIPKDPSLQGLQKPNFPQVHLNSLFAEEGSYQAAAGKEDSSAPHSSSPRGAKLSCDGFRNPGFIPWRADEPSVGAGLCKVGGISARAGSHGPSKSTAWTIKAASPGVWRAGISSGTGQNIRNKYKY